MKHLVRVLGRNFNSDRVAHNPDVVDLQLKLNTGQTSFYCQEIGQSLQRMKQKLNKNSLVWAYKKMPNINTYTDI